MWEKDGSPTRRASILEGRLYDWTLVSAFLLMSSLSLLDSTVSVLVREIFGVLWLVRMLVRHLVPAFSAQSGFLRDSGFQPQIPGFRFLS